MAKDSEYPYVIQKSQPVSFCRCLVHRPHGMANHCHVTASCVAPYQTTCWSNNGQRAEMKRVVDPCRLTPVLILIVLILIVVLINTSIDPYSMVMYGYPSDPAAVVSSWAAAHLPQLEPNPEEWSSWVAARVARWVPPQPTDLVGDHVAYYSK